MNPDLAFNIGYPNAFDHSLGRTGNLIMVHGNRVWIGCLAMTDAKIEEIYTLCAAAHAGGQRFFRVHIFPFRIIVGLPDAAVRESSQRVISAIGASALFLDDGVKTLNLAPAV